MKKKRRKEKAVKSEATFSHDPATIKALVDKGLLYFYGHSGIRDYEKARLYLKEAADEGVAKAQEIVGLMLLEGMGGKANETEGLRYMSMAADQNSAFAFWQLGMAYANGISVEKDAEKAANYLKKAVDQNFSPARYELGLLYMFGTGVPKDEEKGLELITKAAEDENDDAVLYLARKEKDPQKARSLYEKAIQLGNVDAKYDLAVMLLMTEKKAVNPLQVAELLEDCMLHNNTEAIFLLGMLSMAGFFGEENRASMLSYFRAGAKLHDPKACYMLGYLSCLQQQYKTALEYFLQARQYNFPVASYALAVLHLNSEYIEKNEAKALAYCGEAVSGGVREAQYLLGWMFENGVGVPENKTMAREWFEKSRSQQYGLAAFSLAAYETDEQKARTLYEEAASYGCGEAYVKLGQLIEETDLHEAVKLYEKGAALSSAEACRALQRLAIDGPKPDPERAAEYAEKAEFYANMLAGPSYLPALEISRIVQVCINQMGVVLQ